MARKIINPCNQGFTLNELLISMLAMMIIIGALVLVFTSQSKMSVSEEEILSLQMNLRVATERLSNAFSHAGFGCYDSFQDGNTISGIDPEGNSTHVSSFIYDIENKESLLRDSVIVTYGFKKIGTIASFNMSNRTITLENIPKLSPSTDNKFKNYITFFPLMDGNVFYNVTNVNGSTLTFTVFPPVEQGYDVFMVSPVRLKIADISTTDRFGNAISKPVLYLQNFAYHSSDNWTVAENIEDMQFQYSIDGNQWFDEFSTDLQNIRKVRFWLLGRAENPTGINSQVLEVTDISTNIGDPNVMCIEEFSEDGENYCVMYRVGPFNDGYTRMLSRGEVVLRNAF